MQQARAGATRKAYSNDWKLFEAWCALHGQQPLPTVTATLALYLTHLAELGRKYSSIRATADRFGSKRCRPSRRSPERSSATCV